MKGVNADVAHVKRKKEKTYLLFSEHCQHKVICTY